MSRTAARGRTERCGESEARKRLRDAEEFLRAAGAEAEKSSQEATNVAANLLVSAGIAAADAACCKALGKRSRSQDHRDGGALLRLITQGGKAAANSFDRLIAQKDLTDYGFANVGRSQFVMLQRQATALVKFAATTISR